MAEPLRLAVRAGREMTSLDWRIAPDLTGARIIFSTNTVWQWENRRDSEP